jgi:hypothetical protein
MGAETGRRTRPVNPIFEREVSLNKANRDMLFARLVNDEGYCRKHGLTINYCRDCFTRLYPDLDTPSNYLGETTQRHVMRDGNLTATIEIERPRQHRSGRLFYSNVTERLKFGHYHNVKDGWRGGLASLESWERLSRTDLLKLLANTIWAIRRKKMQTGHGTVHLHGPIPKTIWLSAEVRELMEELNQLADNPKLEFAYRNPERNHLSYSKRSSSTSEARPKPVREGSE